MPDRENVFDSFEEVMSGRLDTNPWRLDHGGVASFLPDHDLLAQLIGVPIGERSGSESGRFAKAIDAWVAHELRRAGFSPDEVWPRPTKPRVMPREVGLFIQGMPRELRDSATEQLLRNKQVAPAEARVLGRAYVKQVDVIVAQWSRGPELMVSTKSMVSSFRNNLANRFEESYGDAKNLRGRFPLAAMGFLFLLRSTVLDVPGTFERAADMLRKLRQEADVYDSTCVVLAEWSDDMFDGVRLLQDAVPEDLRTDVFIATLIERVLDCTPIEMHVEVRERREHRELSIEEDREPDE
ncbi:MAG: hypothetical protein ACRD0Z_04450 [Acidimicrobiales bacterium]